MSAAGRDRLHVPVLYDEVLSGLQVGPGGTWVDGTVGPGGHARGILERSGPDGHLLGIDRDSAALDHAAAELAPFGDRVVLRKGDFRDLAALASGAGFERVNGVLLDLGVSSLQLDRPERGFSFQAEGPLDMRMAGEGSPTAADIVNEWPVDRLADLFYRYGEERLSRRVARAIVAARPLRTTQELARVVAAAVGGRAGGIHPATRTFQALRIAVNDELQALEEALPQAVALLRPGGRLAVISFHSLEDRIVKQYMVRESRDCICPPRLPACVCGHRATVALVTHKPVRPAEDEVARNPRSRSARLRIAARLPAREDADSLGARHQAVGTALAGRAAP